MKKVILSALALFIGGLAYGQVTVAGPGPIGGSAPEASVAVPVLPPAAGANIGQTDQYGNDQRVRVRQAGTSQSVKTWQDNGGGVGGNLARIRQTGNVTPSISGVENVAETEQHGSRNQTTIRQEGDYNNAITKQGANNSLSRDNRARIRQGVANQAEGNYAALEQDGRENQATILQTFDNNDAWTRQRGRGNKSSIVQRAFSNGTEGHEAWNIQLGRFNQSMIDQTGENGGRNYASAQQIGRFNKSKQIQTTTAANLSGDGNDAMVMQGLGQVSEVPITTLIALIAGPAFDPDLSLGDLSGSPSMGASAIQMQSGENEHAEIVQFGGVVGASNYGEQIQQGEYNIASILQDHSGAGSDNYAKQNQDGAYNFAAIWQDGDSNKAMQTQFGEDNIAGSSQVGSGNLLNIHQREDDNMAFSFQHGDNNVGLITQHDGQYYKLRQGGDGEPLSYGSQADILQVGPTSNFGDDFYIDCEFDPQNDWDLDDLGSYNLADICPDC